MKIGPFLRWTATLATLALAACAQSPDTAASKAYSGPGATAIFAGGCFWCLEQDFEKRPGVYEAESGYTGGRTEHPTYDSVSYDETGHAEAVRVYYDPEKVSYAQLVDYFWHHIDPTVRNRQFCDTGTPYRSAIFWQNETEHQIAEASRDALQNSGRFPRIHTEITQASKFWRAEEYHQDFYKKNPLRYGYYRSRCGRDARVAMVWGSAPQ